MGGYLEDDKNARRLANSPCGLRQYTCTAINLQIDITSGVLRRVIMLDNWAVIASRRLPPTDTYINEVTGHTQYADGRRRSLRTMSSFGALARSPAWPSESQHHAGCSAGHRPLHWTPVEDRVLLPSDVGRRSSSRWRRPGSAPSTYRPSLPRSLRTIASDSPTIRR
jgi:hypothetical protein